MSKFILGLIIGLLIIPVCVYFYFRLGLAPVATHAPNMPFEGYFARMGLHARIDKEYPRTEPFQATDADLVNAAHMYRQHCAVCHDNMTGPRTPLEKGMFPKPPKLMQGKGVTDDPAGETYWKIANGIRLSGMPSFRDDLSEHDMWAIAELLARADKLPPDVQAILKEPLQVQ